jgi:hypothetical protein
MHLQVRHKQAKRDRITNYNQSINQSNIMQLISNTIATTTDELTELQQYCILHGIKGAVNITFEGGQIKVWQPSRMPVAESVRKNQRRPTHDEDAWHPHEFAG